jgi:hypothetical protein
VVPGQITLLPASKSKVEPADTTSAERVRAIADAKIYPATDKQIVFPLEVTPEPKLQLQRVVTVRIDKALDDKGQALKVSMESDVAPGAIPVGIPGGVRVWALPAGGRAYYPSGFNGSFLHPVRLDRGEKESKALKELQGTVSAEVLSEAKPMIVVEDVMKAAGKETKGKEGGLLKVVGIDKSAGQTIIRFEMEQPAGVVPDNTPVQLEMPLPRAVPLPAIPPPAPGAGAAKGGAEKVKPAGGAALPALGVAVVAIARPIAYYGSTMGVTLRDDKDNILPARVMGTWNAVPGGKATLQYQLVYVTREKDGTPTKLVFSGRRTVSLNIPFTIKDIQLP